MANLTITNNQVISRDASHIDGVSGGSISAGMPCYRQTNGRYAPAIASSAFLNADVVGISTHNSSSGQPVRLQTKGRMLLGVGAAPVAGVVYVLSATEGLIAEAGDIITAGHFSVILGVGIGSNEIDIQIYANESAVVPTP